MVDIPGNATTTGTISVGGSLTNSLEVAGDSDWFRIELTAGQQISVFANSVTLTDPIIRIRDSAGTLLYTGDDWGDGLDAFAAFGATYTGTYFIDIGSAPNNQTGTYELSVTPYVLPPVGTIDDIANQMTDGYWNGDTHHFAVTQGGSLTVNLTALAPDGAAVARQALQLWTDIIGVSFPEVSVGGQIVFGQTNEGTGAFSTSVWANGITTSATVNVAPSRLSLHTYLHEIAHALGLGHSGDYNAGTANSRWPYEAMWLSDGAALSIMSYFDNGESGYYSGLGFTNNIVLTPQVADIIAMGDLYGLSTTTRLGDTTYGFNNNSGRDVYNAAVGQTFAYTIFDSGGIDTLDYSGFSFNQRIDLNAEAFSNVGFGVGNVSIARGVTIENAIGGSGNDTLIGNGANNVLSGLGGTNLLTGGAGADTFRGTATNLSGDTITDLLPGDQIHFTDASLASFTFSLSGNILTYAGGSLTLTGFTGTLQASAAASGGVSLTAHSIGSVRSLGDFNGDGNADILWRHANGQLIDWLGQDSGAFMDNGANSFASVSTAWSVVGIGDFNGDNRDDILWRHANGTTIDWLGQSNGGFTDNGANSVATVATMWSVAGIGDFNGDNRDDILWRHANGITINWLGTTSGGFTDNGANSFGTVSTAWSIAGIGDYNGDNHDDILWRHANGLVITWLGQASGGFVDNGANSLASVSTVWSVSGIGDFNGDGRDDILWRHANGMTIDWLGTLSGSFADNGANSFATVSNFWSVSGIGDVNGDGRDDILWRHVSGQVIDWLGTLSGGFVDNGAVSAANVPTNWAVQPDGLIA